MQKELDGINSDIATYKLEKDMLRLSDKYGIEPAKFNQDELAKWALNHGYEYRVDLGWNPTKKTSKEEKEDFNILKHFANTNLAADMAEKYPTATSVGTVVTAPVRGVIGAMAVVDDAIDTATGNEINPYSDLHSVGNATNTIRQTVGDKYASKWFGGKETAVTGNLGKFTYDTLMSMGDNVANLLTAKAIAGGFGLSAAKTADLTSKITSGLMSSGAAADTIANNKLKGYSDEQALTLGIASGITEYLTEKMAIDGMLDKILKIPKSLVKNMVVGFVSEGAEEGVSNIANKLTDYLIAGEDSDISMAIQGYMDDGLSQKDAINKAIGDSLLDDARAMLSGGFSGMGMSAAYQAPNRVKTNIAGRRIATGRYKDVTLSAVLSKGLSSQKADIRQKAEILADMEQGDTKKNQYHYRIGELAMDILAEDKFAFTSATKMENARKLTEAVARKVSLSEKEQNEMLETTILGDLTEAKLPYDRIVGLVNYRTNDIVNKYHEATGRALSFEKIFNANLKAVSNKAGVNITDEVIMDYADAFVQSIARESTIYTALAEKGDDIAKVIYDTHKHGVSNEDSQTIRIVAERFGSLMSDLETNSLDMHHKIYGEQTINLNEELTKTAEEGTIKVTDNAVDVSPVVNAMTDTLKSGALSNLSRYMESHSQEDVDQFGNMLIDIYRQTGGLGELSKYFADGGRAIIEAIENIGGNTYGSERTAQGRTLRDTSDVERTDGERTQERSEGIPRETGDAQSTASETAVRKQIKGVTYNEVQRDAYTDDMIALENENKSKYGVDTVYFAGHAIDGSGTEGNGFYYKGTLYLQIDDVHPLRSIRDHEITHHSAKTKAYDTFRKAVKAKMSVEQFKTWKEEVRLAYGDILNAYLVKKFKDSGGTLSDEQLQTLMDDYLEEEMMANLNAETVDFANEYAQEIADFRGGIDNSTNISSAEVSTEGKAENKPGEYSKEMDAGEVRLSKRLTENDIDDYLRAGSRTNQSKQKALADGKKIILVNEDEITTFIHDSIKGSVNLSTVGYGRVNERLSQDVDSYSDGKIKIEDSFLELVPYDIKHAYDEHLKAKETGDIDLSLSDFENIPQYIDYYDELVYATRYKSGNTRICLSKKLPNGRVLIIETVSKSRGSIAFKNMIGVSEEKYTNMLEDIHKKRSSSNTRGSESSNISLRDETTSNDRVPQNDTSVKNNSMQETEKLSAENEDIRFSASKQPGVMWTMEQGVLNKNEVSAFYSKVSELRNNKYHNYVKSSDGEYIFAIENKMVFTDGDYDYPEISRVVTLNADNETEADTMRRLFYDLQKSGNNIEDALSIIEYVYGQGAVTQANNEVSGTNARFGGHGQREHGATADSRSGEDVKLSVATETQDRIEKIAKEELFHEELTELARKNKKEFTQRVRDNKELQRRLDNANRQMRLTKVPIADRGKVTKVVRDIVKEMHGTIKPGIKTEITRRKVTTCSDGLFFEALCDCQYSENCFNTPFYYAMKELGFTPKKKKPSYPMEIIRNTGIVNLTINNVNPYLISRVAGISLSSLECLLRRFKNVIDDNNYGNERINQEISKVSYYQSI